MPKFVIDEDMPRSTGQILQTKGYTAMDIRDHGLCGAEDEEIYKFAQEEKAVLLTGDKGFGNLLKFPLGSHCGILIARFPDEISTVELNRQLLSDIATLKEDDFFGNLIILAPGRIRIKRVKST
ncbi:MAG: DUF5615 family PIN-like protein [Candidatus Scalindua sediminis]|nr:DUF5615 family PIN-like protein [Candidatus Scalindua sediminis]HDY69043.1 hypothetical protein [Candidatus Scalindua sp.]